MITLNEVLGLFILLLIIIITIVWANKEIKNENRKSDKGRIIKTTQKK